MNTPEEKKIVLDIESEKPPSFVEMLFAMGDKDELQLTKDLDNPEDKRFIEGLAGRMSEFAKKHRITIITPTAPTGQDRDSLVERMYLERVRQAEMDPVFFFKSMDVKPEDAEVSSEERKLTMQIIKSRNNSVIGATLKDYNMGGAKAGEMFVFMGRQSGKNQLVQGYMEGLAEEAMDHRSRVERRAKKPKPVKDNQAYLKLRKGKW